MRSAERTDPLWQPKGSATASEIVGVWFPPCTETAAEISPTIDPNGYPQNPINRAGTLNPQTFCSVSFFFLLPCNRRTHRAPPTNTPPHSPSPTPRRITEQDAPPRHAPPPLTSGRFWYALPNISNWHRSRVSAHPVHRVRCCSSALPNHHTFR